METSNASHEETLIGTSLQTSPQDLTKYSQAITPLITTTLKIHPACLEFAPSNISHTYPEVLRLKAREYFVVGTYQLAEELESQDGQEKKDKDDKHQERIGGLSLFRFQNHESGAELYHVQSIFKEYGVYSIQFLPYHPIFAASTTTGRIAIFHLTPPSLHSPLQITEIATHLIFPSEPIIISLSWHPLSSPDDKTRILAITVEDGGLYLIRFNLSFTSFEILNNGAPIHEHVYKTPFFSNKERVWCCSFSSSTSSIFSGGDDNYFRSSTLTLPAGTRSLRDCKETDDLVPLDDESGGEGSIKEQFPAGVISILPLTVPPSLNSEDTNTQTLLIGSYDNNIYLCILSTTSRLTHILNLDLGGGVYRLKLLSSTPTTITSNNTFNTTSNPNPPLTYKILACCMHAGTKILSVHRNKEGQWSISILAEVKDNTSMCYAADIQPLPISNGSGNEEEERERGEKPAKDEEQQEEEEKERICVSSSWADSRLTIWKYRPNALKEKSI